MLRLAWKQLKREDRRLVTNKEKVPVPIKEEYIQAMTSQKLRSHMLAHMDDYQYRASVDKHVWVDGQLVAAIERKAYAENAMMKRILVDFYLLRTVYPDLKCFLFQMESQLGGDYSELPLHPMGSRPTHTLMSYFGDVDLTVFTLLRGERNIERPIHKTGFFKPLTREIVQRGVDLLAGALS